MANTTSAAYVIACSPQIPKPDEKETLDMVENAHCAESHAGFRVCIKQQQATPTLLLLHV
jgi:hypothetical protein